MVVDRQRRVARPRSGRVLPSASMPARFASARRSPTSTAFVAQGVPIDRQRRRTQRRCTPASDVPDAAGGARRWILTSLLEAARSPRGRDRDPRSTDDGYARRPRDRRIRRVWRNHAKLSTKRVGAWLEGDDGAPARRIAATIDWSSSGAAYRTRWTSGCARRRIERRARARDDRGAGR